MVLECEESNLQRDYNSRSIRHYKVSYLENWTTEEHKVYYLEVIYHNHTPPHLFRLLFLKLKVGCIFYYENPTNKIKEQANQRIYFSIIWRWLVYIWRWFSWGILMPICPYCDGFMKNELPHPILRCLKCGHIEPLGNDIMNQGI